MKNEVEKPLLLTTDVTEKILEESRWSTWRKARTGKLRFTRIGGRVFYDTDDVLRLAEEKRAIKSLIEQSARFRKLADTEAA